MKKTKDGVERLNINLPSPLMRKIEAYAEEMNVNKTSAVCIALSTFLRENDAMKALSEYADKLPKEKENK